MTQQMALFDVALEPVLPAKVQTFTPLSGEFPPADAVSIAFEMVFDDGCGAWVEVDSHAVPHSNSPWYAPERPIDPCPSIEAWGAVGGFGEMHGHRRLPALLPAPKAGTGADEWAAWASLVVHLWHREGHCDPSKRRSK